MTIAFIWPSGLEDLGYEKIKERKRKKIHSGFSFPLGLAGRGGNKGQASSTAPAAASGGGTLEGLEDRYPGVAEEVEGEEQLLEEEVRRRP